MIEEEQSANGRGVTARNPDYLTVSDHRLHLTTVVDLIGDVGRDNDLVFVGNSLRRVRPHVASAS